MNESRSDARPFRMYLTVLRRRKWSLLMPLVAGALAAASFVLARPPTYTSSAELVYDEIGEQQPVDITLQAELVTSPTVLDEVVARTGVPVGMLAIRAEQHGTLPVLRITAEAGNPDRAQQITQAVVDAYLESQQQRVRLARAEVETALQARIDEINAQLGDVEEQLEALERRRRPDEGEIARLSASRDALLGQFAVLRSELDDAALEPLGPAIPQVLTPASLPVAPAGMDPSRAAVIGALVGVLVGFGVVLLREQLDERTRSTDDVEKALGVPVLASVPRLPGKAEIDRMVMHRQPLSAAAESFRMLREALVSSGVGREKRVVVILSALEGEGKTTVAANLAAAFAERGLVTLAVDADLRQPNLHRLFDVTNEEGLSEALSGLPSHARTIGVSDSHLSLLSAGRERQAPQRLLTSPRLGELMTHLTRADVVVVDTPPMLAVAEVAELLRHADAAVLVTNPRMSGRPVLARLRAQLRGLPALVGVTLNETTGFYEDSYHGYRSAYYRVVSESEATAS
ncbi:MAG: P-loop NTPase [Actinobacteria bacterium]|nr:P-loop NTPase [Actinomycetota bacterium]